MVIVVPNSAAVKNDSPWESSTPQMRPTARESSPTSTVSYSTMRDTWPGVMPSTR